MIKKLQNVMTTVAGSEMAFIGHGIFFITKNISFNP